jgi:hypothetical protein
VSQKLLRFARKAITNKARNRVLTTSLNRASVLALNAVLADSPEALTEDYSDETANVVCQGIKDSVSIT